MENNIIKKYTVFDDNDSSAEEKTDVTPENMKKIDDVISSSLTDNRTAFNYVNEQKTKTDKLLAVKEDLQKTGVNDELKIIEDESPNSNTSNIDNSNSTQQSLSFTIDFGKTNSNTKYKTMLERFQSRHKRGASMSKLDSNDDCINNINSSPIATKTPKNFSPASQISSRDSRKNFNDTEAGKVKLRIRERSTSGVRDPSKRHSWSPRSSTVAPQNFTPTDNLQQQQQKYKSQHNTQTYLKNITPIQNKEMQDPTIKSKVSIENRKNSDCCAIYKKSGRSDFAPRSTAMQMALDKIDFLGLQPPLDNLIETKNYDGDDNVSETGTYTLDGDNYTEEQKDLMNIDKTIKDSNTEILNYNQQKISEQFDRPSELSLNSMNSKTKDQLSDKRKNILEVNYFHESTNLKPKISYLEKIKSRVKNFTKSPDKQQIYSSDKGTFTSITTSGILAKKLSLDPNPKLNYRKNSLTTSQIDSSEYVGNNDYTKTSLNSAYSSGVFTDHEKAEYCLLSKQNSSSSDNDQTPSSLGLGSPSNKINNKNFSDTAGLKTAQTKSDWIQEWARNARARSVSNAATTSTPIININKKDIMSRSYNCETALENQLELGDNNNFSINISDNLYNNKVFNKTTISNNDTAAKDRKKSFSELILSGRPPLSPSKIPSPMHSIGRARSVSKNRGSLQDLSQNCDTDIYLQKTAEAITNLTQNLSRKNSLRSLNSMNSPRKGFQFQTSDLFKITNNNKDEIITHKRNLSLDYRLHNNNANYKNSMSNSLNDTTLINDYRLPRPRINSFDSNNLQQCQYGSPRQQASSYIDKTLQSIKQNQYQQQNQKQQLSPLRRSSSFSTNKKQSNNSARITSPIALKSVQQTFINQPIQYNDTQSNAKNTLQKSASSNSFRKMYSNDYDDSIAYYINDEDDLDYCSSEDFDNPIDANMQQYNQNEQQQPDIPLTNTRYNKALLMRIESSKQKVTGNVITKPAPGGVMACPNTPEMPRRQNNIQRTSMRQSVPRDSSLNRLKGEVPNSLASAKKQLLQTATTNSKPQPRYLDISKYKPQQGGNTFLKKNEAKITLNKNDIRRSPSSVSVSLSRNDPARSSSRSIKATVNGRPSSGATKRDQSISKQKENDLAMWKRRATYDPMKAAAEDKRKKDEAKKLIRTTQSSSVLRSQSFNCGVGGLTNLENTKINLTRRNSQTPDDLNNCWTLISSDDEDDDGTFISSSTNTAN